MAQITRETVPKIKGWLSFGEVAERIGVSNQGVAYMVFESGVFRNVVKAGERPLLLIAEADVDNYLAERAGRQ